MDSLVGRTLSDFIVREKIGEGGVGSVYRAEQPALSREAVIKTLREDHRNDRHVIERFMREAKIASRIDHPYAAHIYAFGAEPDGLLWIAMELVRGTPLDQLLAAQGRLPVERFVPLLERLCEVIHTAHDAGIVHRDLKPANVIVIARAGRLLPKLLDLGIAKLVGAPAPAPDDGVAPAPSERASPATTQVGGIVGSPRYMAPEQWVDAASVGPLTDVYALGAIAFEAITGAPPFDGDTDLAIAKAHARAPVPPLGSDMPAALHDVLSTAMAKRASERYTTALELAAAFRRASGIADDRENLPQLDERARTTALTEAPEPIAEAVSRLEATRSAHQARDAMWGVVDAAARFVGNVALACRTRVGAGAAGDAPEVVRALRALRRAELRAPQWIALARELCRPFAGRPDAYPIPELVTLWFPRDGAAGADAFESLSDGYTAAERGAAATEACVRAHLLAWLPRIADALGALSFLNAYPLAVATAGGGELRTGVRRAQRGIVDVPRSVPREGHAMLLDADRCPVIDLWPLVQAARPSPEAPTEMFVLTGPGRHAARLVAESRGFELHDDNVWSWFATHLLAADDGGHVASEHAPAPYRGLAAFTADDADMFFGRDREVDAFVNRLRTQPLLSVVGPSGAGKSSFIHAGVVPALGAGWRTITVRPGPAPLATLQSRLSRDGIDVGALDDELADYPGALGAHLRAFARAGGGSVLLVVDQFEELFTLGAGEPESSRYAAGLVRAARSADDPVRVVITLRDDFLARAARVPELRARLAAGLQLVTTPLPHELLEIVTRPAARLGYDFDDPELPGRMVEEVADQRGALALLSFTAANMWELRDRHFCRLTRASYDSMGGVGGALAQHAEATIDAMSREQRALVREAFRHLVMSEGTRAALERDDLAQLLGGGDAAQSTIEALVGARLLVASEGEHGGDRIEIVHEALLDAWPRLVAWRREDAEGARLRDQLRIAARQWEQRERPRGLLWRGDALAEYALWRARYPGQLTDSERAFGDASSRDAARGSRIRRLALAAVIAGLIAGVLALYRANQRTQEQEQLANREAERSLTLLDELHEEQGRQALLAGDPLRGLVHLGEAYQHGANSVALRHLLASAARATELELASLPAHSEYVTVVRFSPDGTLLATAGDDGAKLWNADSYTLAHTLDRGARVGTLEFDRDGARVLTSSEDGAVHLWDARTGRSLLAIQGPHGAMQHMARLSHDGTRIVSYGVRPTVEVWNANTGALVETLPRSARARDAMVAADAPIGVGIEDDGTAFVFDTATGRIAREFSTRDDVFDIRVDPAGERLTTTHIGARRAYVWSTRTGELTHELGHADEVITAFFSPDGARITTSSRDGTASVWDSATGDKLASLSGHGGAVQLGEIAHGGGRVVTCSLDSACRIWNVDGAQMMASLIGHQRAVDTAQFDPSDQRIASGDRDGVVKVWAVREDALVRAYSGDTAPVTSVDASADGRWLLAFDNHYVARIWDEATGEGYDTGRITAWDPGRRFAFEYRSAYLPPEPLTEVEVRFEPIAAGTRVTLEHRGFEKLPPKLFEDWKGRAWKLLVQWFAAWCARR